MPKARVIICFLIVVASASPLLLSTTILYMDSVALFENSSKIAIGKVKNISTNWGNDGKMIFTHVKLDVEDTLKGVSSKETEIVIPGGAIGNIGVKVNGVAKFKVGEKVLVYLSDSNMNNNQKVVTGFSLGKFEIFTNPQDGREMIRNDMDELYLIKADSGKYMKVDQGEVATTKSLDDLRGEIEKLKKYDK